MLRYLIGIDDTDGPETPGTAPLSRRLADWLESDHLARPGGITRHQLSAKKQINYTAHNSAVCISVDTENVEGVWETARDFLALESDRHSSPGICLSRWDSVGHDVIAWGQRAKKEVLSLDDAEKTAAHSRVRFASLKGKGTGLIGALAAIGLHREGNDGRFIWLPGLRDLQGRFTVGEIFERSAVDRVCTLKDVELPVRDLVELGDWARPLLRNGQATLYVEEKKHGWSVLGKEQVKELSS